MFKHVQQKGKLANALLKQIEKQRNGEVIETSLVKKVIDSLGDYSLVYRLSRKSRHTAHILTVCVPISHTVSLGLDETDTNRQNLDVYRADFERPFISATEVYYKTESDAFVAENSVTDYMKKAEARLKEEEDRIELYLHPSTRGKVS